MSSISRSSPAPDNQLLRTARAPKLARVSNSSAPDGTLGDRYWVLLIARAIPAAILTLVITFSQDHSASLGHIGLGAFAVLTGAILVIGARMLRGMPRTLFVVQGTVTAVGGVVALATIGAGLPVLLFLVSALFAATGVLELVTGLRSRRSTPVACDWIVVGGLGMLFAIAVLFIPVDYSQAITIPDKVVPNLTASTILVGALGAYAALVAVYLVIAGLSLKWDKHPAGVGTSIDSNVGTA